MYTCTCIHVYCIYMRVERPIASIHFVLAHGYRDTKNCMMHICHEFICTCVNMYKHIYMNMYIYIYIYLYMHIYIHMYIYTCMYTYMNKYA